MELYQLKAFATVARTGHLTRASVQLAVSQSALSAQIKALEEEFGMPLFERTATGMVLTSAGRSLLIQAGKVLAESDLLLHKAKTLHDELVGTLRIGLNEDSHYLQIARLCNYAAKKYAHLNLKIENSSSQVIVKNIADDNLDCGFIFGKYPDDILTGIFLCTLRIMIVAPISWKEQIANATWTDLLSLPWIGMSANCPYRLKIEELFRVNNLGTPQFMFLSDQDATTLTIIESGAVGLVKESDAVAAEKQGKVVIWKGESFEMDLSFLFKTERVHDPLIEAIVEFVQQIWHSDAVDQPDLEG